MAQIKVRLLYSRSNQASNEGHFYGNKQVFKKEQWLEQMRNLVSESRVQS